MPKLFYELNFTIVLLRCEIIEIAKIAETAETLHIHTRWIHLNANAEQTQMFLGIHLLS